MLPAFLSEVAMSNRRFEMYQYRQVLVRMRQGDSDRDIARSRLMGRKKVAQLRAVAQERGWLVPDAALPEDAVLATLFARRVDLPSQCISSLEPWRAQIVAWREEGIQGTTIHAALVRRYGYTGSYSAVHRFLKQLPSGAAPEVPLRLSSSPARPPRSISARGRRSPMPAPARSSRPGCL